MRKIASLFISLVIFAGTALVAFADDYQTAQDSIRQGDLKTALASMKKAVDGNPGNKKIAQEFMLLRQMLATSQQLDRERNSSRWNGYAQRLRTFYEQNNVEGPLLELDRRIYAKTPNAHNAAMLAESLIAAGETAEAEKILTVLPVKSQSVLSKIVLASALLGEGKKDEAKKIAEIYSSPQTKELLPTTVLFRLARLEAALSEKDASLTTLRRLFEQTPPSGQGALRDLCKSAKEFSVLQSDAAFESALKTTSKVTESACSGGSSCGTCPMRAKCQGQ